MKLCIVTNRRYGPSSYCLEDIAVTLGRSSENDVQIPDECVSRTHLILWGEVDNRYYIKELGSENGTYVNGGQVPVGVPVEVRKGQTIVVGKSLIQLTSKKAGLLFAFLQSGFPVLEQISGHKLAFS